MHLTEPAVNGFVLRIFHVGRGVVETGKGKAFVLLPFTAFLAARCAWYLLGLAAVRRLLGNWRSWRAEWPRAIRWLFIGLLTGTCAMGSIIVTLAFFRCGYIDYVQSSTAFALLVALGWVGCSVVGAAAEEVLYRGMILSTLERLGGKSFAIVGSAAAFALSHLGNPGVTKLWLLRLFLQGMLLAWAVFRTGSLWWSIGYHAGWNFGSAPLFGVAESGYGVQGHLFTFVPAGPDWLTGGEVGPEGSVLAFLAMLAAAVVLTNHGRRNNDMQPVCIEHS
ncbi:CPBP family intramembrane metalloprotease [Luteibacter flocculans]|uniref:CPBP family intramembrane metalloprotease n=1 Tax=Luteibacter flocculans TaxID=2780091 RepID=A0ABY4T258_9GAMM|nr:CPBP family intramembrane glutamic endopeptidase [Luteibacter flocculans]URL57009.1 CPBP family intramembrane metalloprotease [Luteibacter flocculans]